MFNWLFGKKENVVERQTDWEVIVAPIGEIVQPKRTFFDYMLDNKTFKEWYYNEWVWSAGKTTPAELLLGSRSKTDCQEHRKQLKEKMSGLPEPIYHVFQNGYIYVFEGRYTYLRYTDGIYVLFPITDIRPPVMRLLKDISVNFCDWNYSRSSEYKFVNLRKLIADRDKLDSLRTESSFEYKLEKNGISVQFKHSEIFNRYSTSYQPFTDLYSGGVILFNEDHVDISDEEALILHAMFRKGFGAIRYEEKQEDLHKDAEKREKLDSEIAKAL